MRYTICVAGHFGLETIVVKRFFCLLILIILYGGCNIASLFTYRAANKKYATTTTQPTSPHDNIKKSKTIRDRIIEGLQ